MLYPAGGSETFRNTYGALWEISLAGLPCWGRKSNGLQLKYGSKFKEAVIELWRPLRAGLSAVLPRAVSTWLWFCDLQTARGGTRLHPWRTGAIAKVVGSAAGWVFSNLCVTDTKHKTAKSGDFAELPQIRASPNQSNSKADHYQSSSTKTDHHQKQSSNENTKS